MNVDEWILWRNAGSYWEAQNVQEVECKGLEIMTNWTTNIWGIKTISGINYSYTSTEPVKSTDITIPKGRQMEYVPLHSGNIHTTAIYKSFDFSIDSNLVGEQYINGTKENALKAHALLNCSVGYILQLNNKNKFKINGMINNILNTDYQSTFGYAMPGANYRLSLTYNIN